MEANNMEAMRKTLEEMAIDLEDLASSDAMRAPAYSSIFSIFAEKCRKCLAAPPRNCDIYLTEEAVDAATVTVRDCEACSRIDMEAPCVFCMVRWLLAPATEKEGGAK